MHHDLWTKNSLLCRHKEVFVSNRLGLENSIRGRAICWITKAHVHGHEGSHCGWHVASVSETGFERRDGFFWGFRQDHGLKVKLDVYDVSYVKRNKFIVSQGSVESTSSRLRRFFFSSKYKIWCTIEITAILNAYHIPPHFLHLFRFMSRVFILGFSLLSAVTLKARFTWEFHE